MWQNRSEVIHLNMYSEVFVFQPLELHRVLQNRTEIGGIPICLLFRRMNWNPNMPLECNMLSTFDLLWSESGEYKYKISIPFYTEWFTSQTDFHKLFNSFNISTAKLGREL